jgi:hypothetical protein
MDKNNKFRWWSIRYIHLLLYIGFCSQQIVKWFLTPAEKFKCDPFFILITIICCKPFMFIAKLCASLCEAHIQKNLNEH